MKNVSKYLLAISGFLLCASLAHADDEECDSVKHKQSKSSQGIKFDSVDTNNDGGISKSEFNEYYAKHNSMHFKELDANSDGKITSEELQGNHGEKMKMGSRGTTHLDKRFYSADVDHDGGLDKVEAKSMPMLTTYFSQVDSDKDGKVTRQEYFDAMPLLHRAKQIDTSGKSQSL